MPFCHVTLSTTRPDRRVRPAVLNGLGDHIRERRLDLCLLKKQLAIHLCVDETTIHNWEDKGVVPAIRFMPRIIKFLGYYPNDDGDVLLSISDKLKAQRTKLGLSRRRLATVLEIDQSTLAGWERGEHRPTKKSLQIIDEFLSLVAIREW